MTGQGLTLDVKTIEEAGQYYCWHCGAMNRAGDRLMFWTPSSCDINRNHERCVWAWHGVRKAFPDQPWGAPDLIALRVMIAKCADVAAWVRDNQPRVYQRIVECNPAVAERAVA